MIAEQAQFFPLFKHSDACYNQRMRRFSILVLVCLAGAICVSSAGCKLPAVPDDKKVQTQMDSPDAPKPSVNSDDLENHNAVTEGEDDASKARRERARKSIGL